MEKDVQYTVIGAGNGGQAIAGFLGMQGYRVNLYDAIPGALDAIRTSGGIRLEGAVKGFGPIQLATDQIREAMEGSSVIIVVNPSIYHRGIAEKCAPHLKPDQMVFLHPGATFGAFAFKKALEDYGCHYQIPIAESNTLIYACRILEPGTVLIGGIKERLLVATLPAKENERVCAILRESYPQIEPCRNVLVTSMDNTNPMLHPAPTLLSTSWVESGKDFLYYYEGISKTIGRFITRMDEERLGIGSAIGLQPGTELFDSFSQYRIEYNATGDDISEIVRNVPAYSNIYGPKSLQTRYIYEDIPMGLVPLSEIGRLLGCPVPHIDLIIRLGESLMEEDFTTNGRNLKNLGLEGMTAAQILAYANEGVRNH